MQPRLRVCNFILVVFAFYLAGCSSTGDKKEGKEVGIIRLHLETNPLPDGSTMEVPVFRKSPVLVNIYQAFFLDESMLKSAEIMEDQQGYRLALEFNPRGGMILENMTTSYRGSRIVAFGGWGDGLTRWLAAPITRERITNGVFSFTPDATIEECKILAEGLNRVAKKNEE